MSLLSQRFCTPSKVYIVFKSPKFLLVDWFEIHQQKTSKYSKKSFRSWSNLNTMSLII